MAKTQIRAKNIDNRTLTGASFIPELMMYDETKNYSSGDIVNWKGSKYIANTTITSSTLESDLSNAPDTSADWDKLKPFIFSCYPSASQSFNNTKTTISFDSTRYDSSTGAFSISAGDLTFNVQGTFLLNISMSFNNSSTTRTTVTTSIQQDTGSGYLDISNIQMYNYSRTTLDGKDTSSVTIPLDVSAGDKIRVQAVNRDVNNVSTVVDGCNITLFPIDSVSGIKGDPGVAGPAGDLHWLGIYNNGTSYVQYDTVQYQGSTYTTTGNTTGTNPGTPSSPNAPWELVAEKGTDGAGATITISEDSTNINNTPHGTLNFITPLVATDAGGGVADINVQIPKNTYMNCIWAEENAALGNNTYEAAFGNGANTPNGHGVPIYVPIGYKCELVAMGLTLRQGTATVEAVKNTTLLGSQADVTVSSGISAINDSFTPVAFNSGDIINFHTTTQSGTGGPNVFNAWFKYTEL